MVFPRRYPSIRSYAGAAMSRRFMRPTRYRRGSRRASSTASGTHFVGKVYRRSTVGREVPYNIRPGVEARVFDTSLTATTFNPLATTSSLVTPLNLIDRGTGIFNRDGQRVYMKNLIIRLRATLVSIDPYPVNPPPPINERRYLPSPVTCRVLVVWSKVPLATPPVLADILTIPGPAPLVPGPLYCTAGVQRIDSRENYQILYDNKFVIRSSGQNLPAPSTSTLTPDGDFTYRDLDLQLPIRRSASYTATSINNVQLSDVTSGSLWLFTAADMIPVGTGFEGAATFSGSVRLVFSP